MQRIAFDHLRMMRERFRSIMTAGSFLSRAGGSGIVDMKEIGSSFVWLEIPPDIRWGYANAEARAASAAPHA